MSFSFCGFCLKYIQVIPWSKCYSCCQPQRFCLRFNSISAFHPSLQRYPFFLSMKTLWCRTDLSSVFGGGILGCSTRCWGTKCSKAITGRSSTRCPWEFQGSKECLSSGQHSGLKNDAGLNGCKDTKLHMTLSFLVVLLTPQISAAVY